MVKLTHRRLQSLASSKYVFQHMRKYRFSPGGLTDVSRRDRKFVYGREEDDFRFSVIDVFARQGKQSTCITMITHWSIFCIISMPPNPSAAFSPLLIL